MKVYFVDQPWEGTKVYIVSNSWEADVIVGTTNHPWEGVKVYRVANPWEADMKIFVDPSLLGGVSSGGFSGSYSGGGYTNQPFNAKDVAKRLGYGIVALLAYVLGFILFWGYIAIAGALITHSPIPSDAILFAIVGTILEVLFVVVLFKR